MSTALSGSGSDTIIDCARDIGLDVLPNDLTRLLYLASLRDCNSGSYLHPVLSPKLGTERADQALNDCHVQIFHNLLEAPVSAYLRQLEDYIRYTGADRKTVVETWYSLQAYRATIPVRTMPICGELFCLNIEIAITILLS